MADHPKHENDALNDQWVAAFAARDFATIESLMAPDALLLAPGYAFLSLRTSRSV